MKKKLIRVAVIISCLTVLMSALAFTVSAASYQTFTYNISGSKLVSPDAYTPTMRIDSSYMNLDVALSTPVDLFCGPNGDVYIVDSGNNCVYVLDEYYKYKFTIKSFTNSSGISDILSGPQGGYATDKYIYVCDTDNSRIVLFDLNGQYVKHFEKPSSDIFEEDSLYKPSAIAVDNAGRMYVVSSTTYEGVMLFNSNGNFESFLGAQQTSGGVASTIISSLFSNGKKKTYVPTEFSNITIDSENFIYITSKLEKPFIKKVSASNTDVLAKNGFFEPYGNIDTDSLIVDLALGPEKSWTIADQNDSVLYTYDQYGNLMFAFGQSGYQLGNITKIGSIAYHNEDLLVMDISQNNITIFTRTDYGDLLINALKNENERNYGTTVQDYRDILRRNSNFDQAYVGIGRANYNNHKWSEAMNNFKAAYDTTNYSAAFKMYRQEVASKFFILIPIIVIGLIAALTYLFTYAKKVNKRTALKITKRTFGEEFLYGFHVIMHPFEGFYDLKHERRGSVRAAFAFLAIGVASFAYQGFGRAYLFNPTETYPSIFSQCLSLVVPVMLWVTANWCLTTLFDGEGSFKDIFIATCYALLPLAFFIIPATALTNVLSLSEANLYNILITLAWVWVGLLVFCGTMVTHDYSLVKNVITCIGTVVAMVFIMFCGMLFSALLVRMIGFVSNIVTEISYRL